MYELSPVVLTIAGIALVVIILVFVAHKLTSAIFWSIMLGPAFGNAIMGFMLYIFQGETTKALESLRFAPFFLAPIDASFFPEGAHLLLIIIGFVYLFLWTYILGKFVIEKFGVWGLPILPPVLFVAGMSLPCLRAQISRSLPSLSWLVTPYYGVPLLSLATAILFLVALLRWRREGATTL